jgi:hypothetical protein
VHLVSFTAKSVSDNLATERHESFETLNGAVYFIRTLRARLQLQREVLVTKPELAECG